MRWIQLTVLLLVPTVLFAQGEEKPKPDLTACAPKGAPVLIRVAPPERIDAVGREVLPLIKSMLPPEGVALLEKAGLSAALLGQTDLDPASVDRTKPIYVAPVADGGVAIATTPDGGLTRSGSPRAFELPQRGTATELLAGDVSLHFYAGEVTEQYKNEIEGVFQFAQMMARVNPMVPDSVRRIIPTVMDVARGGIHGIESIDYALTWKGGTIESEGRLTPKPDSGMRKLLARAGDPQDNGLAAYLPADAFVVADMAANADWPRKEAEDFFDKALGEGAGAAFSNFLAPDIGSWGVTTGRQAFATQIMGMQSFVTTAVHELRPGVEPAGVIGKFDVEQLNATLKKAEVPVTYKLTKDVAKHGETALHRIEMESEDPVIGMMAAMMQIYVAAENGLLFVVSSPTAEEDMKALLDRARKGPNADHPHLEAMGRLGRKRNFGVSFNLGSLKQFAPLAAAFVNKEAAAALGNLPDSLLISTAVSVHDGVVHWRGDWPAKQMIEIAAAMTQTLPAPGEATPPKKKGEQPGDEDFD